VDSAAERDGGPVGTDADDRIGSSDARAQATDRPSPVWGAAPRAPHETEPEGVVPRVAGTPTGSAAAADDTPPGIDPGSTHARPAPTAGHDTAAWEASPDPDTEIGPQPYLPDGALPGPIWGDTADTDIEPVPVIEFADVTKIYRTGSLDVAALRGVDLRIDVGEYFAVMGPSGSGKSTLMHIIGCLDVATEGTFRLAGENVGEMDEVDLAEIRNRRIGFVFQQFNLLPSLTAWRNVELPLTYARVPRDVRRARALEALDRVGLADRVDHRPGELSGGQQQRVAVARALVTDPALILADEPTGNLDSVATADVLALFDELHEQQRTIVLITHEMEVAQRAHRIIRVRDGMIVSKGSHQETGDTDTDAHAAEARAGAGVVPAVSG